MSRKPRRRAEEVVEEIDLMGQESEHKAAKVVKEIAKRDEKIASESEAHSLTQLTDKKKNEGYYREAILKESKRSIIDDFEIPQGYYIDSTLTSKGLVVGYRHFTDKMWFMKGMIISMNPTADMQGMKRLINDAVDEIQKRVEGVEDNHLSASGIVLPNGSSNGRKK